MLVKRVSAVLGLLFLLSICRSASAHPMGNFSVNHYSKITFESDAIRVRYFIDLAEIPTYQELQLANVSPTEVDPQSAAVIHYVTRRGTELGHGLDLEVNGQPVELHLVSSAVLFPAGAGGLPTMKMGFVYEAAYAAIASIQDRTPISLHYADNNYPGHTGWKEIIAQPAAGSLLRSSVPANDRSSELSNYPTDLLTSPPQDLEASLVAALPPISAATTEPRALASPKHALPVQQCAPRTRHHAPRWFRPAIRQSGSQRLRSMYRPKPLLP